MISEHVIDDPVILRLIGGHQEVAVACPSPPFHRADDNV